MFSGDGRWLAFLGVQTRARADAFVVPISTAGDPINLFPGLGDLESVTGPSWSPSGTWLAVAIFHLDNSTSSWRAFDMSGSTPGSPVDVGVSGADNTLWTQSRPRLITVGRMPISFNLVDVGAASAAPVPLATETMTGVGGYATVGSTLAYTFKTVLKLVDLDQPTVTPTVVPISTNSLDSAGTFTWSADGKFIAIVDNQTSYVPDMWQVKLMRTDGSTASAPIAISASSDTGVAYAWQP
jgi:hypothetical protein